MCVVWYTYFNTLWHSIITEEKFAEPEKPAIDWALRPAAASEDQKEKAVQGMLKTISDKVSNTPSQ